ncbi:NAD(P)-binding protein [Apiospora marii]|uniref:NAD(P)-binding protein n=1 Tax=Apiospora marii TaxID=335849 RepID=UPI00312FBF68
MSLCLGGEDIGAKRFADFELTGKVFVVTGGANKLGLGLAEALVEAGGKGQTPGPVRKEWRHAQERVVPEGGGSLHYRPHDPSEPDQLQQLIKAIAEESGRLDGLVAAEAYEENELDTPYRARLTVDFTGVVQACTAAAQEMMTRQTRGTIVLVAHLSSMVASRAPLAAVLGSLNAALVQLARDLATRWSPIHPGGGGGGIRVNCLSPGNILMGQTAFEKEPYLKEHWARENAMGRLADISEFKSAVLFLSSKASSFMTGSNLVIDGGRKQQ